MSSEGLTIQKSGMFSQFGQNAGYVEELYRLFLSDPALVGETWAGFFRTLDSTQLGASVSGTSVTVAPDADTNGTYRNGSHQSSVPTPTGAARDLDTLLALQERATRLVSAYRERGHLASQVNPLHSGVEPLPGSRDLDPAFLGIEESDFAQEVQASGFAGNHVMTLGALLAELRRTYCASVGFEFGHVPAIEEREWLHRKVEQEFVRRGWFSAEEKRSFFAKLYEAEALEAELHKRYVGSKRFSLQGGDTLIPMLEVLLVESAKADLSDVVIGMAHRGRLNVLANIADKPLQQIFAEFEDASMASVIGAGDVKYHQGISSVVNTSIGKELRVTLAPNPSHLEFVNPVVSGVTRAIQDTTLQRNRKRALALLIHGDAAFIGQGVVSETLNFANSAAYTTAGAVHVVINNQVGFTTDAREARSSVYCTDIAKINGAPIFHVNGEDVEACCWAMRIALEYRNQFGRDVVIDLYCYRKYGHNEGDDPTFTQPLMYAELKGKKPMAALYSAALREEGVLSDETQAEIEQQYVREFAAAAEALKFSRNVGDACALYGKLPVPVLSTAAPEKVLTAVAQSLTAYPADFTPHPKLKTILDKRVQTFNSGEGFDWGLGEALAYGSLLAAGVDVRLTGQDAGRGTFSHRHLELHDYEKPGCFYPLQQYSAEVGKGATFEVYNSTLSEASVMAFEFGYSATHQKALVLWEAQFGDFANGAQVIIDQFLASSEVKWGQRSGIVLLLPHGYEGQGPEHSSARLERFLQLCAEGNMSVVYATTPAQYFHMLRRQGLSEVKRPVIVMTPKSLLRLPEATSSLPEFTSGRFMPVLSDTFGKPGSEAPLVLMSGKIFYDLKAAITQAKASAHLARIEEIYPFPQKDLALLAKDLKPKRIIWVQEEPRNMGAWNFVKGRLAEVFGVEPRYEGRPESASTACGSARWHSIEQKKIIDGVLSALK